MINGKAHKYSIQQPDFLMGLGALYFAHNLLDPAEEVLAQIPPESPLHVKATILQIEIYSRKQNYQEVVHLAETLMDGTDIPTWLAQRFGIAYHFLGQTPNAKAYLLKSVEYIPENSQVVDKLRTLQPPNHLPKVEDLVAEVFKGIINPHVALDCIAPILWGGRPVSCCFEDQLLVSAQSDNSELDQKDIYLEFASTVYQRFGIFTAFLPYIEPYAIQYGLLVKVYFSLDPSIFDRVENIKQSAWNEWERQEEKSAHRLEYLEKEGVLLGYPTCCVEWARNRRSSQKSIETIALTELIREDYACSSGAVKVSSPELAYFAFEFYPCDPRCNAAEAVGEGILEQYEKTGTILAEIYWRYILPFNKTKIYYPYPTSSYNHFVQNLNDAIVRIFKVEDFKKAHQDYELYREGIIAILEERPDLVEDPDGLSTAYEIARERLFHHLEINKEQLVN